MNRSLVAVAALAAVVVSALPSHAQTQVKIIVKDRSGPDHWNAVVPMAPVPEATAQAKSVAARLAVPFIGQITSAHRTMFQEEPGLFLAARPDGSVALCKEIYPAGGGYGTPSPLLVASPQALRQAGFAVYTEGGVQRLYDLDALQKVLAAGADARDAEVAIGDHGYVPSPTPADVVVEMLRDRADQLARQEYTKRVEDQLLKVQR